MMKWMRQTAEGIQDECKTKIMISKISPEVISIYQHIIVSLIHLQVVLIMKINDLDTTY